MNNSKVKNIMLNGHLTHFYKNSFSFFVFRKGSVSLLSVFLSENMAKVDYIKTRAALVMGFVG